MVNQQTNPEPLAPNPKDVALQAAVCLKLMCENRDPRGCQENVMDELGGIARLYLGSMYIEKLHESFAQVVFAYVRKIAGNPAIRAMHQLSFAESRLLTAALIDYDMWADLRRTSDMQSAPVPPRTDWTKYNDRLMAGCVPA